MEFKTIQAWYYTSVSPKKRTFPKYMNYFGFDQEIECLPKIIGKPTFNRLESLLQYGYLREKLGIRDPEELRRRMLELCRTLDFNVLTNDVQAFLFFPKDAKRAPLFSKYIETAEL